MQYLYMMKKQRNSNRHEKKKMVGKLIFKIMTLCMVMLCCHACGEKSTFINIEHPFICFINQSDDTVWVEMKNSREITFNFNRPIEDSLFYGMTQAIQPNSMAQMKAEYFPYWEEYHYDGSYVKDTASFIARVFVMDSCAPTNIKYALNHIYYESDSIQVINTLKEFEKKHLLLKKWYSREELDSMNWTIVYPQK